MQKKGIVLLSCLLVCVYVSAQQWATKKLMKGVQWKSAQGVFFNARQNINVIEVKGKRARLKVAYSDSLEKTSQLAINRQALAAINGSFFKMRGADPDYHSNLKGVPKKEPAKLDHNRSVVYLRQHDSLIAPNIPDKDPGRRRHQQGAIVIDGRRFFIVKNDSLNLRSEERIVAHDVMSTGPVMLLNGIEQPIPNDAFCNDRHPRTAMGRKADGTVVLLVVDGRAKESAGMSIPELQQLMKQLGCRDAINLDGGGSSTMYIKGEGVVNYPTDNKQFDHEGEREVANAIIIVKL